MAKSQFKIYSSNDPGSPFLSGGTGSLISVFDACLVTGYGSGSNYKAPAGWLQPLATISGSIACYQQPSGSRCFLHVNDIGSYPYRSIVTGSKEAWVTGWENLTSLTSSTDIVGDLTSSIGAGNGQFPLAAQTVPNNTKGNLYLRKSVSTDGTIRQWILAADDRTFYFFVRTGDIETVYYPFWFGDIFSLAGQSDTYKCMIGARQLANSSVVIPASGWAYPATNWGDSFYGLNGAIQFRALAGYLHVIQTGQPGFFIARSWTGVGTSVNASKSWDFGVSSVVVVSGQSAGYSLYSYATTPNPTDNSISVHPINVWGTDDPTNPVLRGRIRGLYQVCNYAESFVNGQIVNGMNDYSGKTFGIIKYISTTFGILALETSNTVETN